MYRRPDEQPDRRRGDTVNILCEWSTICTLRLSALTHCRSHRTSHDIPHVIISLRQNLRAGLPEPARLDRCLDDGVWIGVWMTVFGLLVAAFEAVAIVKKFTRFTEEIFSTLVCLIFIYESFVKLIAIFQTHPLISEYVIMPVLADINTTTTNTTTMDTMEFMTTTIANTMDMDTMDMNMTGQRRVLH
ncbi:hypothetical protein Pmani_015056 [Petrolisthes manimaculis]|uniref:Bicarbonate transporter-like transmembrane domain-containing protein n=1 Tax=Petrolisthes manimaculis TaxID=1843537 RepID=A0AAE1PSZ4_9EUCA|nr:hypothetical protein Pmani_015056 [Petrolisthes manimaculis]